MKTPKFQFIIIFLFVFINWNKGQNVFNLTSYSENTYIGKSISIFNDESAKLGLEDVIKLNHFESCSSSVPNLGFIHGNVWVKFEVKNLSAEKQFYVELEAPLIDEAEFFDKVKEGRYHSVLIGQTIPFTKRKYKHPSYIYDLFIQPGETASCFLRIKSYDQVELPIKVSNPVQASSSVINRNFLIGIFCGIMLIMIFYNVFIYFSTRDISYLYYAVYIFSIMLTQTTFQGYTFKYLWPNSPWIEVQSIHLTSILVGYTSVQFLRNFLNTSHYVPRLDRVFKIAFLLYGVATLLVLLGFLQISWILILCIVSPLSMFMIYIAIKISSLGYRPAKYFVAAWSVFLIGVFIYAMKDFNLLPHNNITVYTMPIGSAVETVLLSLALADRINILKRENELAQLQALEALKENERLSKEQNVFLEKKVKERTAELEASNKNLKEAEAHLINVEKMASIGQLTAGISHEINNPINFVVSNVKPLKRDMDDILAILSKYDEITDNSDLTEKLKNIEEFKKKIDLNYTIEEIHQLLKGIDEGANRTAEIIKGLKYFSRTDEAELKKSDVQEGIDSTLSILANNLNSANIKIKKKYADIPKIECYPGKLNQVFMNVINNAIHAVSAKKYSNGEGVIEITTQFSQSHVQIGIKDNGIGIPKSNFNKIFEPFYTTKDVGSGIGLGLSIVYGIINSHNGKIDILSEENHGAEFIITLPIVTRTV